MTSVSTGAVVGTYAVAGLFLLIALSSVGSIVTYIIIVVANRADPDPTGRRTSTIYHAGAAFLTLWLEVAGAITILATLFALIGSGGKRDSTVRGITIGLLLFLVGGFVAHAQRRKAVNLAESDSDDASPSKRVVRSYAAVVSFISVIVMVVTVLAAVWAVLGLIAPGVYEATSRTNDARLLLDEATVLVVFAWVFSAHRRLVDPRAPTSLSQ
jgi:hypothetical protein